MAEPAYSPIEKLMNEARKVSIDYYIQQIEKPGFQFAGKCHDWRNHVNSVVQEVWDQLRLEAKLVAFVTACELAHREEWE